MSEIFESYEKQYTELSTSLSRKSSNVALLSGEQRKLKVQELKNGLEEAESLIRRMDLEARSLPATQKAALLAKLREHKADLNNLKREVKKVTNPDGMAERDELLNLEAGGTGGTELTNSADQRGRLLASTNRLNQTTDKIRDGRRALLETEELGVSILQDLHQQRQTLLNTRDTLHNVDDNISRSRQILNSMSRRMNRNKWVMVLIILILILAIGFVIYAKAKSH
eukprot:TRINITY_DN6109_c0_g2_i1.p1 TRINITY_DN6109_c0_g2~~TRINITY_DN6109_c0_g2_i1.p1  ORF type:complete len:226 (+),score=67.06 TRINITY_DN6109_c0_g2_i1:213-890(+)